jgi:hypothetical protein
MNYRWPSRKTSDPARRHRQMCVHLSSALDTFYGPEDYVRYP